SRVWNLAQTESLCNGCDVGCSIFIEHRQGKIYRYKPRVNPEVNDFWLCDYGRFSHERYEVDRVVVPRVRRDDWLGVATWDEALEEIETHLRDVPGGKIAAIASAQMTNEEAWLFRKLFKDHLGSGAVDVMVDPIGPIPMKSRDAWLEGTQAGPNYRGVRNVGIEPGGHPLAKLIDEGADGIDFLWVSDAGFSARSAEPEVVARLRKARFLVVQATAEHPLAEVADVVLPSAIFAEKSGTWTNLQGRVQRIARAYAPKGEALEDSEIFRRLGARIGAGPEFGQTGAGETFDQMRNELPAFRNLQWNEGEGFGVTSGEGA
ncbi:MAG: molybdopterin-dependent oxidoreductase, partial [Thermoanaerobaculia bacterium]